MTKTSTVTPTSTISPTSTHSPTVTPTSTITPTHTPTTTAQPAENLDGVIVYPNPYVEVKANYRRVNFIHLTFQARVRVYTLDGVLVWEHEKNDASDRVRWEGVVNNTGEKLASGVYVYLITNDLGQRRTGKIAIIR